MDAAAVPAAGAIWHPGEGWVDLPSLVGHLAKDFTDCGGQLVTNAGPATVLTTGDAVRGVRTSAGEEFPAEIVVLATGSAVPAMVAEFGVTIPDATPAGTAGHHHADAACPQGCALHAPSIGPADAGRLVGGGFRLDRA